MVDINKYYSRQIALLGLETFHKLNNLHVLVSGLRGTGVECVKNLSLAGVGQIVLHDDNIVTSSDLSTNYFLNPGHIGTKTRSQASLEGLKAINPEVKLTLKEGKLDEAFISQFSLIILTETSIQNLVQLNNYCRTKNPPIGFICSDSWGGFGYVFVDMGPEFITYDRIGDENKSYFISNITKENPGIVSVYDRHYLQDGNYVVFKEVQGMEEINNTPPRPVRVVTPYSFSIEDTTGYSAYQKEGIVEHFKIPEKLKFKSLELNLSNPSLGSESIKKAGQYHICTKAMFEYQKTTGELPDLNNEDKAEQLYKIALKINEESKENHGVYVDQVDKSLVFKLSMHSRLQVPCINAYWGGIISTEVIKFNGKYNPIMQWMHQDWFDVFTDTEKFLIQGDLLNKISQSKCLIVGLGALGSEVFKLCTQIGIKKFVVVDKSKFKISDRHLFYNPNDIGVPKVSLIEKKEKAEGLNIKTIYTEAKDLELTDLEWSEIDFVINCVDNHTSRVTMDKKCVWYEKNMIEGSISNTLGSVAVYKPFVTQTYTDTVPEAELQTPLDILLNFPYNIDHCLEYSRLKFNYFFNDILTDLKKFIPDPTSYLSSLAESGEYEKMEGIYNYLELLHLDSYNECVKYAYNKFQDLFFENINELLMDYPADFKDDEGKMFWTGFKRLPVSVSFDSTDDLHLMFIESTANLIAKSLGIQVAKVNYKEVNQSFLQLRSYSKENLRDILSQKTPGEHLDRVKAMEFDPSDQLHNNFVYSTTTIRARSYKISEVDRLSLEILAERINGSLASVASTVASYICIEIYKLFFSGSNQNTMINQATNSYVSWEPAAASVIKSTEATPVVKAYPERFTKWDKIQVQGPLSLNELVEKFEQDFGLRVSSVSVNKTCVFNAFLNAEKNDAKIEDLFSEVLGKGIKSLPLEISSRQGEIEVVTPVVKYIFSE